MPIDSARWAASAKTVPDIGQHPAFRNSVWITGFIRVGRTWRVIPMWTLLMPVAAALITTIVVLGLFKAAGLKRVEDLMPPPPEDEWDRLRNYKRQD